MYVDTGSLMCQDDVQRCAMTCKDSDEVKMMRRLAARMERCLALQDGCVARWS